MAHLVDLPWSVLQTLLDVSLKAAFVFGVVLLGRTVLIGLKQRRSAHLLWLVLVFRLCLPVDLPVPLNPIRLPRADLDVAAPLPARTDAPADMPITSFAATGHRGAGPTDADRPQRPSPPPVLVILGLCWLAGVCFFGSRLFSGWRRQRRLLARMTALTDAGVLAAAATAASLCRFQRPIRLRETSVGTVPYVTGLFRPVIVLPRTLIPRLSRTEWVCVLTHELFHLKRNDLPLQAAVGLLTVVYWFNPLVWIAALLHRQDGEAACDTAALGVLGADAAGRYGGAVLRIAECFSEKPFPQCALGIIGNKNHLVRRLLMIRSFKRKPSHWRLAGMTLIICAALVFCMQTAGADDGVSSGHDRTVGFTTPVAGPKVTLEFGWAVNALSQATYFHNGMDMAVPIGTAVRSVAAGIVLKMNEDTSDDLGRYVVIRHADGFTTWYTKLKSVMVKVSQTVAAGTTLGLSGVTGVGTGPHLHFMLMRDEKPVNPREYILF